MIVVGTYFPYLMWCILWEHISLIWCDVYCGNIPPLLCRSHGRCLSDYCSGFRFSCCGDVCTSDYYWDTFSLLFRDCFLDCSCVAIGMCCFLDCSCLAVCVVSWIVNVWLSVFVVSWIAHVWLSVCVVSWIVHVWLFVLFLGLSMCGCQCLLFLGLLMCGCQYVLFLGLFLWGCDLHNIWLTVIWLALPSLPPFPKIMPVNCIGLWTQIYPDNCWSEAVNKVVEDFCKLVKLFDVVVDDTVWLHFP